jgi:hypothetical protein
MLNPAQPGDEDARVDARNPEEVRRWAERVGVSAEEFQRAAERAGPRIGDIRQHLIGGFSSNGPTS